MDVNYTATVSRDVVAELWKNNTWLTNNVVTVAPGTGTANIIIKLSTAPLVGETGYLLKYAIRPVGTTWRENIDNAQQTGISIVETNTSVIPPSVNSLIRSRSSNKCVDVTAGNVDNGAKLQQYTCISNNANQQFLFQDRGNGYWGIQNETSSKCIDKTNSAADGAIIQQWNCWSGNDNQSFKLVDKGQGYFQLVNKHSDKCLGLIGGEESIANGIQLQQSVCSNSQSQQFKFN